MSNEHQVAPRMELLESSNKLRFSIEYPEGYIMTPEMTPEELRTSIIKQIEVLSYYSENPTEVFNRFNIARYGETV